MTQPVASARDKDHNQELLDLHSTIKALQEKLARVKLALNTYQESKTKFEAQAAINLAIEEAFS